MYTHLDGPHSRIKIGEKKIGQIAANREPIVTDTVIGDPRISEQEWAKREGMIAFAGFPLVVANELVGVMAMFTRRPFPYFTRTALAANADEIALGIHRTQAVEELLTLNAELERRVADRTAQLNAANKELEAFSYSVSHDLTAPLRRIEGFNELLREELGEQPLSGVARSYLDRTQAATVQMSQLIQDLLSLSQVIRHELVPDTVNLTDLANAVAADLRKSAPERQVELSIAPGLVALGDARLLRVVLDNLLGNAWKYTSKRAVARIELATTERDGQIVHFVRDDGAGFDMAFAGKLFVAFQRLHGPSEFEGTGIGLATVQRIIQRHGGRIWGEGKPEEGATFYFTLPAPAKAVTRSGGDEGGSEP
jgi:light-regulated signal transduction histidine kinase (bacteriophytochrome)